MSGNSFGKLFKLSTFGESHGEAIGGVIDGCPAGIQLDIEAIQLQLDRRKPGQSHLVTQRKESDTVKFLSGIFEGKTTGMPIGFIIPNEDQRSKDYAHNKDVFRPSHADYTYFEKYGIRDYRGGGRSSARETACRVVGGSIAEQFLKLNGIEICAWVYQTGEIKMKDDGFRLFGRTQVDKNLVRCPEEETAIKMQEQIEAVRKKGDTIGGIIRCLVKNVPVGLGEPVFDKLHADLGKAMLSINAVKGFEFGAGFASALMKGSEMNDEFIAGKKIKTKTNFSGGIQGGISNGEDIYFSVAFKPVATIVKEQETINEKGESTTISGKGRHDPCVVPRAVPIVESMTALVLADYLLRNRAAKL